MAKALQTMQATGEQRPFTLAELRQELRAGFGAQSASSRPSLEVLILGLAGAAGPGGERAAEALKQGFRPWTKVFDAAPELVAAALRPVEPNLGQALKRAETLIATMRRLVARSGGMSLDFLAGMQAQDASTWLEDALGLAPPLVAAVLSAGPIRHRVAWPSPAALRALQRLGLAPAGASPATAGRTLAAAAPPVWNGADLTELCALLQALGEGVCHVQRQECAACPVAALCPSAPLTALCANPGAAPMRPMAYLRRRIARLEGAGGFQPQPGLRLGEGPFSEAVFPLGLPFGVHQAAAATPLQGAAPLILALAMVTALDRRDGERRDRGPARLLRRRAPAKPPPEPGAEVRLLMVQEIDATLEHGEAYPPGFLALGVDPAATAFVTVDSGAEAMRVIDEALKLRAAPVLVAELRRGEGVVDLASSRRLNLAARRAEAFLLLITPDLANTSAALTRWRVAAAPSRGGRKRIGGPAFTFDLVRNRLGPPGAWTVEWDLHERRFRNPEPCVPFAGRAGWALPSPHLPPPVDRPAVAHGRAAA